MQSYKATIKSSGPTLEACMDLPAVTGLHPGVVLCHPHPLYGGDMENAVVMAMSRAITANGMAVLRFNFRGVGKSRGTFADGEGELEDALSALAHLSLQQGVDPGRIGIAGYSFGGMVAMGAANTSSLVKAMAAVSPVMGAGVLEDCHKPKYIIAGADDSVVSVSSVRQGVESMADPKEIEIIEGADHFWWGQSAVVGKKVAGFFAGVFFI